MKIREKTEKKVFAYLEEHRMIAPGEKIVAGVSGGADSVCLLFLLLSYRERVPLSLAVAHINHSIRSDAEEDARYVEDLCRESGIPFFLTVADVRRRALEEKCSEEDAGRRIRYEAFRRAAEELGGARIAVAHNSGDNAETMLFHLFRGTGIKGLSGILPVRTDRDGMKIIRPLLCLEREEIEAYLEDRGIEWRRDSTNSGDDYRRNRIRHHILPYAEREIAGGAAEHMLQTAELLQETESFLEQQTREALEACATVEEHRATADVERFLQFHPALQKRMLYELLCGLSPEGKDIFAVHIRDTMDLFQKSGHRSVSLPFGITARRQYGEVALERTETSDLRKDINSEKKVPLTEEIFTHPAVYDLGEQGKMEFQGISVKKDREVPGNRYTKWFDYDKIKESLVIRSRRQGDFLTIADGGGNTVHKSLKKYMVTEKIPRQLRDEIPVLAAGSHVLWLAGWRISEYFKVDGNTKRILQVKLYRDCEESETEEENVGTH
ncbi:MAG: tRNA lysidine(34) synthetase TilS [Lachnospiraceae bacterium]|nr:tRNA lysidine(34) synthetase TilS [Lachnospiraceae bacterium]